MGEICDWRNTDWREILRSRWLAEISGSGIATSRKGSLRWLWLDRIYQEAFLRRLESEPEWTNNFRDTGFFSKGELIG